MALDNTTSHGDRLIFPIYGRNIQEMVEYCVSIEDREERQRCAETIVRKMENFSPLNKDREDYRQVLWDHLFIMSGFRLDVDFPYPVIKEEEYGKKHSGHLDNDHQYRPQFRHYGRAVERMVAIAAALPEGEERLELSKKIAIQMKKDYLNWNSRGVSDSKIFTELYDLSKGKLYLDELMFHLPEASMLIEGTATAKGKKNTNNRGRNKRK